MTKEQWFSNPDNAQKLAEIFQHPVWIEALKVWRELSYGSKATMLETNMITGNGDALAGRILGYEKAMQNLELLATVPDPEPEKDDFDRYGVTSSTKPTE